MRAPRDAWGRSALAALTVLAAVLAPVSGAHAQSPLIDAARLTGPFQMAGRVTVAKHILGEHPGDAVLRTWRFTPLCPAGPCAAVQLVRQRGGGTDTLVLNQTAPGSYEGQGKFYVPLRCGRHKYLNGESVPFTITVQVAAAAPLFGVPIATGVTATYENRKRKNLTPCVAIPGHDAAAYVGHIFGGAADAQ